VKFSKDLIKLDCEKVVNDLVEKLKNQVFVQLKRYGAVIGTSGGIDSSVTAALCARALGPERTMGVLMPDKDNSPQSRNLAIELAQKFCYRYEINDISSALEGADCYRIRNDGFRQVFPEWKEGWKAKIILPAGIMDSGRLNVYHLAIESPM
jgi:NAD+ synthase